MRAPITVQVRPFDMESVQPQIDLAREAFGRYLEDVPWRSRRSTKHGLMGPVGKILGEVKSGRRDATSLKGYAVRVHEATGRSPSQAGLEALEAGIDHLVGLLAEAPVTAHDRILDRLDYGLYYDLRKQALVSKEKRRQSWIEFLQAKYETANRLSEAWGEHVARFEDLYLPKSAEGSKGGRASVRQQDVAAFWDSQGAVTVVADEEE